MLPRRVRRLARVAVSTDHNITPFCSLRATSRSPPNGSGTLLVPRDGGYDDVSILTSTETGYARDRVQSRVGDTGPLFRSSRRTVRIRSFSYGRHDPGECLAALRPVVTTSTYQPQTCIGASRRRLAVGRLCLLHLHDFDASSPLPYEQIMQRQSTASIEPLTALVVRLQPKRVVNLCDEMRKWADAWVNRPIIVGLYSDISPAQSPVSVLRQADADVRTGFCR